MKILKIILSVLPFGLIALLIYFMPRIIKINSIECESQYGPCNKILGDRADVVSGGRLVDVRRDLNIILSENIFVKGYSLQYGYPDKLKIFLVEEKPVYALKSASAGVFLVNREGYVLTSSNSTNLPFVETSRPIPFIGEKLQEKEHFALEIIYEVYPLYKIEKSVLTDSGLSVTFDDGLTVIFPLEGDKEVLLGSLNLILGRLRGPDGEPRIEGAEKIKFVDLRFNNPVLR